MGKKLKKTSNSHPSPRKKIRLLWLFTFAKKRYHFLGKKVKKNTQLPPPSRRKKKFFFFAGPTTFKMPERALRVTANYCNISNTCINDPNDWTFPPSHSLSHQPCTWLPNLRSILSLLTSQLITFSFFNEFLVTMYVTDTDYC